MGERSVRRGADCPRRGIACGPQVVPGSEQIVMSVAGYACRSRAPKDFQRRRLQDLAEPSGVIRLESLPKTRMKGRRERPGVGDWTSAGWRLPAVDETLKHNRQSYGSRAIHVPAGAMRGDYCALL